MKSMSERLAFPMYAVNDEDTQALWRAVRQLLAARSVVEEDMLSYQVPEDLLTHWRHPALLLSQTGLSADDAAAGSANGRLFSLFRARMRRAELPQPAGGT